jgi:riboflavin synthase
MFTGIIEATGKVKSLVRQGGSARLDFEVPWSDLRMGESISVDGACLTVAGLPKGGFAADLSAETLRRTIAGKYRAGTRVNLERALKLGDRLGGHLVYGHVDGVGKLGRIIKRSACWELEISVDQGLRKYLADKASVAVNGISLTVAGRLPAGFSLSVVPHTLKATAVPGWRTGDEVNIEMDMMAKHLEALIGKR